MVAAKIAVLCNTRKPGNFAFYCCSFMDFGKCFGFYIVFSVFEVVFFELSLLIIWHNEFKPVKVYLRKRLSGKYLNYLLACFSGKKFRKVFVFYVGIFFTKKLAEKHLNYLLGCFSEEHFQKSVWTICRLFLRRILSEKNLNYLSVCFSAEHFQ